MHALLAAAGGAPDDAAPATLKKYTILGKLAAGGMAELFLATTNGLGGFERLLVIKRILPSLAHDVDHVRMLLDEARIAANLQHSNIVQVFDVDMDDGAVFFVMEHLHGQHAAELLRRAAESAARIPLENAIAIAVAVAAGLHYAHERWGADGKPLEIVHRDVSPNNVVVTYDGNVKLIDFGIAKSSNRLSETKFGLFKGKLPYAAPEQCRCEPVDRRTDVYSLGVMLYELTTGHPVFEANNEYELLRLMTEAVVTRPRMHDKAYPQKLEQIVLRALARDPADRYQTAQALQRDLEVFAAQARLDLSPFSLSRLMSKLFEAELAQWQSSRRAGLRLDEHITKSMRAPSPPPDVELEPDREPELEPQPVAVVTLPHARLALPSRARRAVIGTCALAVLFGIGLGASLGGSSSGPIAPVASAPIVSATPITTADPVPVAAAPVAAAVAAPVSVAAVAPVTAAVPLAPAAAAPPSVLAKRPAPAKHPSPAAAAHAPAHHAAARAATPASPSTTTSDDDDDVVLRRSP